MTDREMLELAAKAAGIELEGVCETGADAGRAVKRNGTWWAPLHDDGDNRRLQVAAKLGLGPTRSGEWEAYTSRGSMQRVLATDADDKRAIVRAAAEIGREMP